MVPDRWFVSFHDPMRTIAIVCALSLLSALNSQSQTVLSDEPSKPAAAREYQVVERGPHHRKVERTMWQISPEGQSIPHVSSYVELATGMYYQKAGQWHESDPSFQIARNGWAEASQGQHQVRVAPNINAPEGAVVVTLPNGKVLRSAILGLSLFDCASGKSLQVAAVKDSTGEQTAPNEITFFNCFEGLDASVRIRNELGQFHQDVVLHERITAEQLAKLGFPDPSTVRVEIWTEFIQPPQTGIRATIVGGETHPERRAQMAEPDVVDQFLDFGGSVMPRGKALAEGEGEEPGNALPVYKQWLRDPGGRVCLLESCSYGGVAAAVEETARQQAGLGGGQERVGPNAGPA